MKVAPAAMWILGRKLALALLVAGLIGGCGGSPHPGAAPGAKSHAPSARALNPADALSPDLVSAVAANKSALPVQVKFELKGRPQVGQPVDIEVVIVPNSASVDRVSGKVEAEEGLNLVDGGQIPPAEHPAEGVPIRHNIRVQAQRDGIFTFNAIVTVDSAGQSTSETYSMPLIAGAGIPDLPAKAASSTPTIR
jgi:hypothetical protein